MLRTAFIGSRNAFDRYICGWLAERSDLRLILWTNRLSWAHSGPGRPARIARRFWGRLRRHGPLRAADEFLYYVLYRAFLARADSRNVYRVLPPPPRSIDAIPQIEVDDIRSDALHSRIAAEQLDAAFSMCIDQFLPRRLVETPRLGTFLWHEGITPEYRGVHSPFWALARGDHERLGYTLLRMNQVLDAGPIYVQGRARDVDPHRDWHGFIGHKAILDSLPEVERLLVELEAGRARPIERPGAVDGYWSYPRAGALARIAARRWLRRLGRAPRGSPDRKT